MWLFFIEWVYFFAFSCLFFLEDILFEFSTTFWLAALLGCILEGFMGKYSYRRIVRIRLYFIVGFVKALSRTSKFVANEKNCKKNLEIGGYFFIRSLTGKFPI